MKLLLIGCSGFIGKELMPRLIKAGHQIILVTRRKISPKPIKMHNHELEIIRLDPSDSVNWSQGPLLKAINNVQAVINLAGEPIGEKRWTQEQCEKISNSRVNTTRSLINAINQAKNKPNILINASAIGSYGTSQEELFNEDSPYGSDFLANLCKEWEDAAYKKSNLTRLVILRIGIVLGSEGGALKKMLPIFKTGLGGPIGSGLQWMSWIHRTDICRIIEESLKTKKFSGVINCVAPEPVQMKDFSKQLGDCLGRPSLLNVPGPILKLLLGDGAKLVLEGQHVKSKKLSKLGFKFKYPELIQALNSIIKK